MRSFFGALTVLWRIFHVWVLVIALLWPLTIMRALSSPLTFLSVSIIMFVISLPTTRFTTSALLVPLSIALNFWLAFIRLRLLFGHTVVNFVVGSLLQTILVATSALATISVVVFTLVPLFFAESPFVEILITGSVVVVPGLGLSLVNHGSD
jgi:hypothetical protein